ncbi:MAG: hypothetical protein IPP61_15785 [Cytophagaceae bacterium]|nr:hypothetical protein [Cytophagaceae bacterium]MBL0303796.1 hypothetical protein [Cytophagaceae bacterium]MBL0326613.1 hypothetical protein [Cytophagaceae bacterium]
MYINQYHAKNYRRFSSTRVWQKWRFSATQTHLWLIKVWFSASTFVVKIATFAKPGYVSCKQSGHLTDNKNYVD